MLKNFLFFGIFVIFIAIFTPHFSLVKAETYTAKGINDHVGQDFTIRLYRPNSLDPIDSGRIVAGQPLAVTLVANGQLLSYFTHKYYFFELRNPAGQPCDRSISITTSPDHYTGNLLKGPEGPGKANDLYHDTDILNDLRNPQCTGLTPGRWTFVFWGGEDNNHFNVRMGPTAQIAEVVSFDVRQNLDEIPASLSFAGSDEIGTMVCQVNGVQHFPDVIIKDSKPNRLYVLWWDGANISGFLGGARKWISRTTGPVTAPITLNNTFLPQNKDDVKLCMAELDDNPNTVIDPTWLPCDHTGDFLRVHIKSTACTQSDAIACQTTPKLLADGTNKYKVEVLHGNNFPANTTVRGDLISGATVLSDNDKQTSANGSVQFRFGDINNPVPAGDYTFNAYGQTQTDGPPLCTSQVTVPSQVGSEPGPGDGVACPDSSKCSKGGGIPCGSGTDTGVVTALGCLHTDPGALIKDLTLLAAGIAGMITLILMVIGAAQMLTSGGNPEQIKKGRDQFVSAVIGLLFIIFSITLLQIIGADILKIPGFAR